MTNNKRLVGAGYERLAGAYLESIGYQITAYNYRCRKGEIDLIARDGEYLVFCEVKYRSDLSKGTPEEAVDHRKQKRISGCALYYLVTHGLTDVPCRFDVIGILGRGGKPQITHYKNAFAYVG